MTPLHLQLPVLITRPQPQADRLAADLRAEMGARVQPVVAPLMRRAFLTPDLPAGPHAAVILSSETGAEAAGRLRAALPARVVCVGERTAAVALAQGFEVVLVQPTADRLVAALIAAPPLGRLIWLHGTDVSRPVADLLNSAGIETDSVVAYDQAALPLAPEALALLRQPGPVVVPLFSARSARLLLAALPADMRATLRVCAISDAVVDALPADLRAGAVVAAQPDGPAMQSAIHCVISSLSP